MTNPTPGYGISTAYGKRGSYWSCDSDPNGNGIHTGNDHSAPAGAKVVAARPGKVVHSAHGTAFGNHQVDVLAGDGTRDFYAHMRSRVANGTQVKAGDKIGEVGSEGNVTGPHLHFERHATEYGGWSCSVVRDPAPSENHAAGGSGGGEDEPMDYAHGKHTPTEVLTDGKWVPIEWDSSSPTKWFDGIGIKAGGYRYSATLSAVVADRGGAVVQTSWVEIDTSNGNVVETSGEAVHGSFDNVVDTRNGLVQSGRRLRARIRIVGGDGKANLKRADVILLLWPT